MGKVVKRYTSEIWRNFSVFANWPLNKNVQIGDVGFLTPAKTFERQTTLYDMKDGKNLNIKVRSSNSVGDSVYSSTKGISIKFKVEGQAPDPGSTLVKANAGVTIHFKKKGAIIYQVWKHKLEEIESPDNLAPVIYDLYKEEKWNPEWVVVSSIIQASAVTIFMSSSSEAVAEIQANASVETPQFNLADIGAKLAFSRNKDLEIQELAKDNVKPFFYLSCLKGIRSEKPVFRKYGKYGV